MTRSLPLAAFVFHMSAADFIMLIVALIALGYLFYALVRGEKL